MVFLGVDYEMRVLGQDKDTRVGIDIIHLCFVFSVIQYAFILYKGGHRGRVGRGYLLGSGAGALLGHQVGDTMTVLLLHDGGVADVAHVVARV